KTDNHPSVCKSFNTTDFLREYVYSAACVIGERHLLEVERAFIALNDKGRQAHLSRKMGFNCTTSDIHRAPNYSSKFR
uniref:Uncharacterized protein n=1 Tax=Trichobilharzia regenti TaxID=157069 RepID=A0AA85JBF2_TRIRE